MRCGDFVLRARFACFLADEKAIKETWSCKGAAGTKMCICCKNVLGRTDPDSLPRDGYLVHFKWATPDQFDPNTDETVEEMAGILREVGTRGSRNELQTLSQAFGLTFAPNALLWDEGLKHICRPVSGTYWDWMHVLIASGGVAQYGANQFVIAARAAGLTPADFDAFAANIKWRKAETKLPASFFQSRVDTDAGKHMHAFASEMFQVYEVIALIIDMVLAPAGAVADHCTCARYMIVILSILKSGDDAVRHLGQLEHAIALHHEIFNRLYPDCAKPKLHFLWHIPQCIRRWGVNMNCFSGERTHRRVKGIASHTFRHIEKHTLGKYLVAHLNDLSDFPLEFHLEGGRQLEWAAPALRLVFGDGVSVHVGLSAVGAQGQVKVGDVLWADLGGEPIVGVSKGCWDVQHEGRSRIFVHLSLLAKVAATPTWATTENETLLELQYVKHVLTHVCDPGSMAPSNHHGKLILLVLVVAVAVVV